MVQGVPGLTSAQVLRKRVYLCLGTLLVAASVTIAFLCMREIMAVGGSCASGGPYQVAQECPSNMWLMFVAVAAGLLGGRLTAVGRLPGGASLTLLAWCALFLSMAWNFFEFGVSPPAPATGTQWGWIVCGIVFVVMGGLPLFYVVTNARQFFWGDADRASLTRTVTERVQRSARGSSASTATSRASADHPLSMSEAIRMAQQMVDDQQQAPSGVRATDDGLASSLERLAALHAAGQLTDDEYAAAKSQLLDDGGQG